MNKKKKKGRDKLTGATIQDVISRIHSKYGDESAILINDTKPKKVDVISTGSILVDEALGIGGLPRGRIIEIMGMEGGGKSSLALHVVAEAQRKRKDAFAAFIDAEHALDVNLAKKIGVDLKRMVISQPDYGEQGLAIAEMAAESGKFDVIVVDSVSALTPKAEIDGEMDEQQMGLQARMMGKGLRKIVAVNSRTNSLMIFINQLRKKIGVMFGSPDVTTGGEALKFYASVRIDIRRIKAVMAKVEGDERPIGNVVRVKIIKNKLAIPYREIETELIFGKGFNKEGELLARGLNQGILEREGASFLYKGKKIAHGKSAAQQLLQNDQKLFDAVYADVSAARGVKHGTD